MGSTSGRKASAAKSLKVSGSSTWPRCPTRSLTLHGTSTQDSTRAAERCVRFYCSWFPSFNVSQNPLEGLLKHKLLDPTPRVSDSFDLEFRFIICIHNNLSGVLQVQGPQFENHCSGESTILARFPKDLSQFPMDFLCLLASFLP